MTMWMVRAGRNTVYAQDFVRQGVVAIGQHKEPWVEGTTKSALVARVRAVVPELNEPQAQNVAAQLYRYATEVKIGDAVATYDADRRVYYLGTVASDVEWNERAVPDLPHTRRVKWTRRVSRDRLAVDTRNSLGSVLTLFKLKAEVAKDLEANAVPIDAPESPLQQAPPENPTAERAAIDSLREDVVERASEFIEDLISGLDPYELQDLVGGLLRAMGYRTQVSPPGADRGVDIFASPDGLGLEEPRIFVEVKHRRHTAMGAPEIRAFLGGRRPGDRCLYVSTGGFTREAAYEAERSSIALRLLNLPELRRVLLDHYEALDTETKSLVPLTRLYWPVRG